MSQESSRQSVSSAEETSDNNFTNHAHAIHVRNAPSVLSKEAPPESYRGFLNLAMLILAANNLRLIIENFLKYGFLLSTPGTIAAPYDYTCLMICFLVLPLHIIFAFYIEKITIRPFLNEIKLAKKEGKEPTITPKIKSINKRAGILHTVNITFILLFPSAVSYFIIFHPFLGSIALFNGLALFFKLISYAFVNRDLRLSQLIGGISSSSKEETKIPIIDVYSVQYPNNITLKDLFYFWFAPTLCYQPSYPRSPDRFRPGFFLKRCGEIAIACTMMYFLVEQYANPTLRNSLRAIDELSLVSIVERVLKLSTISLAIWLLMFYAVFHSTLNLLAEVLRFGDRSFYLAWWNSGSLGTYWRLWNRPVYQWFKRHVYLPLVDNGVSPRVASFIVFTLSAAFHEFLIGIPTHSLKGFAFVGMMSQIPLIEMTKPLEKWRGKGSTFGNVIFWMSFCLVGQPAAILLYYYQWNMTHQI
ncbi:12828_t:CDS:2 [Ambispora gerdemannii]|uniref:O-acyltransferase n=1 Tax=Ambispora gerdemannii TaxID=144530 RepID=A0A9N9GFA6_9GLOM|nr:12828_t:CDS:2 [Ambispora gerdemannii]